MQKTNKPTVSGIHGQTLLKRIEHINELFPTNLQQNSSTNNSSSSSLSSTKQCQNDNLLVEIRSGVQLRHVIPNAHKQCIKMLYDNTCEKLFITENENERKLETEKQTDIGNIILNAMRKRRLLMGFGQLAFIVFRFNDSMIKNDHCPLKSSSTSNEDGNERKLEQWSDTDDKGYGDDQ
ncbi:unnamed protein product [Cercopithifilaria johnstoni]|uniref:WH2 domain-containing protein n=1 Tax=Cercopithifilaria johnstoni TaxID=2874296 RepID=A0A8J2PY40_9BILA|nr:unnamed protein product [Cercopithifilaria johnstoni]